VAVDLGAARNGDAAFLHPHHDLAVELVALDRDLGRRYGAEVGADLDPATQILPVNGSREALFAFAQAVIDQTRHVKRVLSPNPFYQIYEGAALLGGTKPYFLNTLPENGFRMDFGTIPEDMWETVQLAYVCSPGNPTGKVMSLAEWKAVFELADRHDFIIASDECYSEIYFDGVPPPSILQVPGAREIAVEFTSMSKTYSMPGWRIGFAAGNKRLIDALARVKSYLDYGAFTPVQVAATARLLKMWSMAIVRMVATQNQIAA